MKKLILSALLIIAIQITYGQYREEGGGKNFFFSAGPEAGLPANSPFSVSYGGLAKAEIKIIKQAGITLSGGYDVYNYRNSTLNFYQQSINPHPALIPLKAGVRYYSGPGFYAEGELGSAIESGNGNTSGNMFIYSLGLGFEAQLNTYSAIEIGFRYDGFSQRQYQVTGLRVAYRVGW